ncbi:MAG: MG2 domain-containing protein, partial [Candidatus Aureabacteria bacterium]|nr:MG2 domain-containing protein [Candidatus Auribacterota bacterium]
APRIFHFRTEPLRLLSVTQANFTADRRATLRFEFNDAVSPSALVSALSIKNERGRALDFVALGGLDSDVLLVQVNDADTDRLALRVRKGLSGVSGPLGLEKEAAESFAVGTTMALLGLEPSSRSFSGGSIKAIFTAPPALPEASRFIAIDPPVDVVLAPLDSWWDKAGCALEGDFQPARTYTVTFKKGLPAQNGFTLAADITRTVYFPDRPPALSFGVGGNYLSTRGNLLIPVNSVNLRSFKLKANRIFPNNLVTFALRELKGDYGYYSRPDRDLSRSFPERKFSVAGADNQAVETLLDLRPYLADSPSGAFYLTLEAEGSETPSHLAVVTDTAISAKVSPRDLLVWANSIHTLDPVAEAEVKVYSRANQELLSGKTDRDGIARFRRDGEPPGEEPFLVTVRKGEDISYLCLKGTEVDAARDFEGRPYLREGYEAYLFPDRGIYRPGETAHLTAIVRGKGVSCPPSFPVQLKAIGPLGKTEATISGVLDGFGMTSFDLPFPAYFLTGHYRLLLSVPG